MSRAFVAVLIAAAALSVWLVARRAGHDSPQTHPGRIEGTESSLPPTQPERTVLTSSQVDAPAERTVAPRNTGAHFFCRILREDGGEPLAHAKARWLSRGDNLETLVLEELSADRGGWIELSMPAFEDTALLVEVPGFTRGFASVGPGHETFGTALELQLRRKAALIVRVEKSHGKPATGVTVQARADDLGEWPAEAWLDEGYRSSSLFVASSDDQGVARLPDLPAGVGLDIAVSQGSLPLLIAEAAESLSPGEERELSLCVGDVPKIRGRLADQFGEPIVDCELIADKSRSSVEGIPARARTKRSAWTGPTGEFEFRDLEEGAWNLMPLTGDVRRADPDSFAPFGRIVVVPAEGQVEVELVAWRGVRIRGSVRLPSGEPAAHCHVSAKLVEPELFPVSQSAVCDEHGRFDLGPVGGYAYEVIAGGTLGGDFGQASSVRTKGGAENVQIAVERAAVLHCTVLDAEQRPTEHASLHLRHEGNDGASFELLDDWGADGSGISGLTAGTWSVFASGGDCSFALEHVTLAAGERKDVVLTLARGGELELSRSRGAKSVFVEVELEGVGVLLLDAGYRREERFDLPAGRLTLRFLDGDWEELSTREVSVEAGRRIELKSP